MTQPKHTPTPWYLDQCDEDTAYIVPDALAFDNRRSRPVCKMVFGWQGEHGHIADKENEANAAFIVRACNSHDELFSIAKELIKILDGISDVPAIEYMHLSRKLEAL